MKTIDLTDENVLVEGLYGCKKGGPFRRYNDELLALYPRLADADRKPIGARLRFRTDSKKIGITIKTANQVVDPAMSFYRANSAFAFVGDYQSSRFASLLSSPDLYGCGSIGGSFDNDGMNDVTVFLPHTPEVTGAEVTLDDGAALLEPTPHRIVSPFVFYGSSITQQGHTSTPLAYPTLLSRFFDADFYNFGASGNALGEPELAEYLGGIPKSVFFYDYDHNAPTAGHLLRTHEAFFKIFRRFDPLTPVIMTSRPAADVRDTDERARIVRETYENAVKNGDENVYFIDGRDLFGEVDPNLCTTDRTHPNDLGHYLIAKTIEKLLRGIIDKD